MRLFIFFILLLINLAPIGAKEKGDIILLFGTSCAGKSTLARSLRENLPGNFRIVKRTGQVNAMRNEVLQKLTGSTYRGTKKIMSHIFELSDAEQKKMRKLSKLGCQRTLEKIKKMSDRGENVIFDICLGSLDSMQTLDGFPLTKVLVYAPLSTLSFRERTRELKSSSEKRFSQKRRGAILNFYCKLFRGSVEGELPIDYIQASDIEEYEMVTKGKVVYSRLSQVVNLAKERYSFESQNQIGITPEIDYDIFVNTGIHSVEECAIKVQEYFEESGEKETALADSQ